jgi:hypothetical protein
MVPSAMVFVPVLLCACGKHQAYVSASLASVARFVDVYMTKGAGEASGFADASSIKAI